MIYCTGLILLHSSAVPMWCHVLRSNCDGAAANILRTHYSRPYFLPDEAESSKTDWIFMGSPGFGARLHVSWAVVHFDIVFIFSSQVHR